MDIKAVRKLIEKSSDTEHSTGQTGVVFIDRHCQLDVSQTATRPNDDEVWIRLMEEAQAMSCGPYFKVLSFKNGTVFVQGTEYLAGISDEDLQAAILEANSMRDEFYRQRAKEFGPSAYPQGVAATSICSTHTKPTSTTSRLVGSSLPRNRATSSTQQCTDCGRRSSIDLPHPQASKSRADVPNCQEEL